MEKDLSLNKLKVCLNSFRSKSQSGGFHYLSLKCKMLRASWAVRAHALNPSAQEEEAGGRGGGDLLSSRPTLSTKGVPEVP